MSKLIKEKPIKKFYISFGQVHKHYFGNILFDKNCVALIEAKEESIARERAFQLFGDKWCSIYKKEELNPDFIDMFPRGVIRTDNLTAKLISKYAFEIVLTETIDDLYLVYKDSICNYKAKTHQLGIFKERVKSNVHKRLNNL